MKSRKRQTTQALHLDEKNTVVIINGKIFELVATGLTINTLCKLPFDEVPHVRYLNSIPLRTSEEQIQKNKKSKKIHKLYQKYNKKGTK